MKISGKTQSIFVASTANAFVGRKRKQEKGLAGPLVRSKVLWAVQPLSLRSHHMVPREEVRIKAFKVVGVVCYVHQR